MIGRLGETSPSPLGEVRAYWEALRNGRIVPMRAEVDPRGIERALEHAFILERIARQVARFRVAGTQVNELAGTEARGLSFAALFQSAAREAVAETLEAVFDGPNVADLLLRAEVPRWSQPLSVHLLLLPLRSDLGDVSRALGCLVVRGDIGRAPRRLAIERSTLIPLASGLADAPQVLRGLAEARAPYAPRPRGERPRPNLRLVVNRD